MVCVNAFTAHGNSCGKAAKHQVISLRIEPLSAKSYLFTRRFFSEAGRHPPLAADLIVFMTNR
jgi:hypothetical protein